MKKTGSRGSLRNPGNTKRISASKKWCFTLKYVSGSIELMREMIRDEKFSSSIVSLEIGEDGYEHWQGYVEYVSKNRPFGPKSFTFSPLTHWEKAQGSKLQNIRYCSKAPYKGIIITNNCRIPRPIYKWTFEKLYPWQQAIVKKYREYAPPTNRKIDWYWEKTGNFGKSVLCKHLVQFEDAYCISGKAKDIFYALQQSINETGDAPKIIVLDIPRSIIDYISYQAIEKILDGLIFSGKYEGGMVDFNVPWVVCMANEPPDRYKTSLDRWNIVQLSKENI